MNLNLSITGADQVSKVLLSLPRSTMNKALRPAMRVGAAVVKDAAQANLEAVTSGESTGIGAKSLRVYSLKMSRGRLRVAVMVKRGAVNQTKIVRGEPVRVGLYLSVLEYGKQNQPPRSWLRKSAREQSGRVFSVVSSEAAKRINLAIKDAKR